jgi:hypothetical protein
MIRPAFITFCFLLISFCSSAQVNIDTLAFRKVENELSLDNGLVIMGEAHDAKNTFYTEYLVIEELVAKGYKNIYIEGGHSEAAIFNYFLSSGDTACLHYTRAVHENQEFRTFIERLYELNRSKHAGLIINGFDFERTVSINYLFHKWFKDVITKDAGMNKQLELLLSINDYGDRTYKRINENSEALKDVFTKIKEEFPGYEKQYMAILKENFPVFKSIVYNPSYFKKTGDMQRDKWMADAMKAYENEMGGESGLNRSIIITGTYHVVTKDRFIPRLLKELNQDYVTTVFIPVYKNCTMAEEKPYKFSSDLLLLRYLKEKPAKPVITFYKAAEKIVPTSVELSATVLIGFYDQ